MREDSYRFILLFIKRVAVFGGVVYGSLLCFLIFLIAFYRHSDILDLPLKEREIVLQMKEGYHIAPGNILNDRVLKRELLKFNSEECMFIMGSSTALNFHLWHFENSSFLNLGVSSGRLPDLIALYEASKQCRCPHSRSYIIVVDPFVFSSKPLMSFAARTSIWVFLFDEFIKGIAQLCNQDSFAWSLLLFGSEEFLFLYKFIFIVSNYVELFIKRYFVNYTYFNEFKEIGNIKHAYSYYGSRIYPIKEEKGDTTIVNHRAREYLRKVFPDWFMMEKPSYVHLRVFEALVCQMCKEGDKVYLLKLPYHPILYNELKRQKGIKMVERWLDYLARRYPIYYEGSWDPDYWDVDASDFYDATHLNLKGMEKVVKRLRYLHSFLTSSTDRGHVVQN